MSRSLHTTPKSVDHSAGAAIHGHERCHLARVCFKDAFTCADISQEGVESNANLGLTCYIETLSTEK